MWSSPDKRLKSLYLLFFAFPILLLYSCTKETNLVTDGTSDYSIVVSEEASDSEKTAASKLQNTIETISGCKLPITSIPSEKAIYIGFKGAPEKLTKSLDTSNFGDEEYIVRSDGRQLLIAGGARRGTLYGVIGYLSDQLGCRWYSQSVTKIPKRKSIQLTKIEDRQKPDFSYREVNWREAYEPGWSVHNRIIPSRMAIPDSLGGSFVIFPERGHTFDLILPPAQYFKSNPEYFSEINGIRTAENSQLCLTNPEVEAIAIRKVLEWVALRPDASVYSVSQNDNERYCTCSKCASVDKEEGSPAGSLIRFINRVSEEVNKLHPKVKLQTFAYTYSEVPPQKVKPSDNVLIELCHYNYCSAHAITECHDHDKFTDRLASWQQIAKNVTVWGYYVNFGFYLMPFPNWEAIKKDVKYFRDRGTYGLYAEGCNVIGPNGGGEFSELRSWVFAQLMWNSSRDPDALIEEYLQNVYGAAAKPIGDYISLLQKQAEASTSYFNIWTSPVEVPYLSPETISKADLLFEEARKLAGSDATLLKRVEEAYFPLIFTKLYYNAFGAGESYLKPGQASKLAAIFKHTIAEKGIVTHGANESMPNLIEELVNRAQTEDRFYKDWWIAGPFASDEKRSGFDFVFEPEKRIDTTQNIRIENGETIRWKKHTASIFPYIDFLNLFKPNENVVAYAYRNINLPEARMMEFGVGSNDGIKVWVNEKLVLSKPVSRRAAPNQDFIKVPMQKGTNRLLVKVDQLALGWGFYFSEKQN